MHFLPQHRIKCKFLRFQVSQWPGNAIFKPVSLAFMNMTMRAFFSLPYNSIIIDVQMLLLDIPGIYELFLVDSGFRMMMVKVGTLN